MRFSIPPRVDTVKSSKLEKELMLLVTVKRYGLIPRMSGYTSAEPADPRSAEGFGEGESLIRSIHPWAHARDPALAGRMRVNF